MTDSDLSPIVFADLDDTLFQTARKMTEPAAQVRLASRATNGSHSYMTEAQAATVAWLLNTTRLIPTTARSSGVLERTTIAFRDYKICSNGGAIITPDGEHDPEWAARTGVLSDAHKDAFAALGAAVSGLSGPSGTGGLRHWLVRELDTPVYFVAKISADTDQGVLDEAERRCRDALRGDLVFHRNGRNMSFTPKGLTKTDAVQEVLNRLPGTDKRPVWGIGDSVSDLPFMRLCQMLAVPSGSQIAKTRLEV